MHAQVKARPIHFKRLVKLGEQLVTVVTRDAEIHTNVGIHADAGFLNASELGDDVPDLFECGVRALSHLYHHGW